MITTTTTTMQHLCTLSPRIITFLSITIYRSMIEIVGWWPLVGNCNLVSMKQDLVLTIALWL